MHWEDGAVESISHSPQPAGIAYKDSEHHVIDMDDAQLTHNIHKWRNTVSPHLQRPVKNGKKLAAA